MTDANYSGANYSADSPTLHSSHGATAQTEISLFDTSHVEDTTESPSATKTSRIQQLAQEVNNNPDLQRSMAGGLMAGLMARQQARNQLDGHKRSQDEDPNEVIVPEDD